jgi:hypothetical protein
MRVETAEQEIGLLSCREAFDAIGLVRDDVQTTMLDPWYNKGVGGKRDDYIPWLVTIIDAPFEKSQHVFVWGFPEIVYRVLDYLPKGTELVAWLTWYYKNCPSVIRGWRSAQLACLHLQLTRQPQEGLKKFDTFMRIETSAQFMMVHVNASLVKKQDVPFQPLSLCAANLSDN